VFFAGFWKADVIDSLYERLLFYRWFRWLVQKVKGETVMLGLTLTNAEAISLVRKRCSAVSRRMNTCPYEIGTKIVARVDAEGEMMPYAELTVKTIRPMKVKDMTVDLAKGEGFSGIEGWKMNYAKMYGSATDESTIIRIGFDVEKMLTEKLKEDSYDARKRAADTVNP
jgi:hypothetical protein